MLRKLSSGLDIAIQKAVEIFRKAMDYFSNLKQFSVQGQSTLEDMLFSGHTRF